MEALLQKKSYQAKRRPIKVRGVITLPTLDGTSETNNITTNFKVIKPISLKDDWSNFTDEIFTEMFLKINI